MRLKVIQGLAFGTAKAHGFWTGPEQDNIPTKIALIHEEVSEALKCFRLGQMELFYEYKSGETTEVVDMRVSADGETSVRPQGSSGEYHPIESGHEHEVMVELGYDAKPEGFGIELADALIRICDLAERHSIDLEHLVQLKLDYNIGRPMMHGGRRV